LIELIDAVVVDLSPRAASQETAIGRSGDPGPIFLAADPVQLQVALRAMCQNSLDALQTGGHVEIIVETAASRLAAAGTVQGSLAAAGTAASDAAKTDTLPVANSEVRIHVRDDGRA